MSDAHNARTNYFTYLEQESVILLLWKLREVQSRCLWLPMNSHNRNTESNRENQRHTYPDRLTDRLTETPTHTHRNTHTHTWEAGVRHVGHILVVLIMREAQLLHTHRCPQGVNICDCMLPHHQCEYSGLVEVQVVYRIRYLP